MATMEKYYTPKTWKNLPSVESPINEYWLNHMESGINEMDNRAVLLSEEKLDRSEAAAMVKSVTLDRDTGIPVSYTHLVVYKKVVERNKERTVLSGRNPLLV